MFHVDMTFEDLRVIAYSEDGAVYRCRFFDLVFGDNKAVELPARELAYVVAFNTDPNGEPEGHEHMRSVLEPVFVGWPDNLVPIP